MSTLAASNLKNAAAGDNNIVLNSDGTIGGTCLTQTCRAWVNFNGTGTVAIRASYNVSSITDNGTGNYTVNFTTALVDANYAVTGAKDNNSASAASEIRIEFATQAAGSVRVKTIQSTSPFLYDENNIGIAIFR